jgi:hypothetical protein
MNPVLHLPSEMMLELAMGLEPPITVLQKYGFQLKDLVALENQAWFNDALMRERERLRDEGYVWQAKARLMNESLIEELFKQSRAGALRPEVTMDLIKTLGDMTGQRKPPQTAAGANGPMFQINITLPENPRGPTNVKAMIEGQKEKAPEAMTVDFKVVEPDPVEALGPRPVRIPDFALTSDLVGPATPSLPAGAVL